MALRLRTWIGATLVLCVVVALNHLPPDRARRAWGGEPVRAPLPEARRFQEVADEVVRTRGHLRRLRLADTVVAHARQRADEGWSVEVLGADSMPEGPRDALEAAFLRDLATLPHPRPTGVVLGAWVVPPGLGSDPGPWDPAVQRPRTGRDILLATRDGTDYCVGVAQGPISPRSVAEAFTDPEPAGTRRRDTLGICWWVGAYGFPGPGIAPWLADGAALFGNERVGSPRPAAAVWTFGWWGGAGVRRGPFGLGLHEIPLDGCLAGRTDACARLFAEPALLGVARRDRLNALDQEVRGAPTTHWISWSRFSWLGAWGWMLADLHGEFGGERFRAFWTSPADPEAAFQEAFGVQAGAWVGAWMTHRSGHVPPGPLPRSRALVWVLAVVGAAAALSVAVARRRQAE